MKNKYLIRLAVRISPILLIYYLSILVLTTIWKNFRTFNSEYLLIFVIILGIIFILNKEEYKIFKIKRYHLILIVLILTLIMYTNVSQLGILSYIISLSFGLCSYLMLKLKKD